MNLASLNSSTVPGEELIKETNSGMCWYVLMKRDEQHFLNDQDNGYSEVEAAV